MKSPTTVLAVLLSSIPIIAARAEPAAVRTLETQFEAPKGLGLEGQIVAQVRYTDRAGTHFVVVTETTPSETAPKSELEDATRSKKLFAFAYRETKKKPEREWTVKDFVLDCPFDLTVAYEPASLSVTDLDDDGVAEVALVYRLNCASDVSPATLKLIMYEGKTKYALRGTERVPVGEEGGQTVFEGGTAEADPAFKKAPAAFLSHAQSLWRRYAHAAEP